MGASRALNSSFLYTIETFYFKTALALDFAYLFLIVFTTYLIKKKSVCECY